MEDIHSPNIFGRQHSGGLDLQCNTAMLHMHDLFTKSRKWTAIPNPLMDGNIFLVVLTMTRCVLEYAHVKNVYFILFFHK